MEGAERARRDLSTGDIGLLCLDGYKFSEALAAQLAYAGFVVRFDDFGNATCGHVIIDGNLGGTASRRCHDGTTVLCGPQFAVLHPDYAAANARARATRLASRADRVLVSFGARDTQNTTSLALRALAHLSPVPTVTAVLGLLCPHMESIARLASSMPNVHLVVDAADMVALYAEADLALGAGGMSLLERLCCGVPSILVSASSNQGSNIRGAVAAGLARYAGPAGEVSEVGLAAAIASLRDDAESRQALRQRGIEAVDGRGALRVSAVVKDALQRGRAYLVN